MQNNTSIPSILKPLEIARQGRTLRQLAEALNYPPSFAGTLSDILRGRENHVSRETFRGLSVRLGMPPLPETEPTAICQSCLELYGRREVHAAGDCGGAPVAAVVCLRAGEVVAAAPTPAKRKRTRKPGAVIHVPPELHAAVSAERRPGESLADVVARQARQLATLRAIAEQPIDTREIDDDRLSVAVLQIDGFWRGVILAEAERQYAEEQ